MLNREPSEQDILRAALGPGKECPPVEDLERYISEPAFASAGLAGHVKSCAYCRTELQMMQAFHAGDADSASEEVRRVTEKLRERSNVIVGRQLQSPAPWWRAIFAVPRLAQAAFALAAILAVTGIVLHFRPIHDRPSSNESTQTGPEVLRSGGFSVSSPVGDVQERPAEIRWEKVPRAANYQVRLLEVDQSEIWKAETPQDHIALPSSIRTRIVPAKTLFCEVSAFDSSGLKIGETGLVRFRLVQTIDRH